jgi:hypothetical protein
VKAHAANKAKPGTTPLPKLILSMDEQEINLMKKLYNTAFYIAEQEKPYTDFVGLLNL